MTARCAMALVVGLALAGCSPAEEPVDDGASDAVEGGEELDLGTKPDTSAILADDRGEPPTGLEVTDLVEGDGQAAEMGDEVTVHYVGVSWSSGEQFDASWDRGQPYSFTLGEGEVIEGWEQGVEGMNVGGRRVLVIPPDLAYGDQGAGTAVAPGETIVFVVDLLELG